VAAVASFFASLFGRNRAIGPVEKVFFGIGNPGRTYENTRHNAGFSAIDWFAHNASSQVLYQRASWEAVVCKRAGMSFALVKPKTFVNQCGEALGDCLKALKCPLSACLVIVDDYHLPLGKVRIRSGGSDGGHNGLKSIIERVGTDFPRLRIGIGPLSDASDIVGFVLGRFTSDETAILHTVLARVDEAAMLFARKGIEAAMNAYNR
jgi:peptidyl-tRNA hydrolase, PTH1 family